MKVVYASRTGNVQKLIDRLGLEATKNRRRYRKG